MKIDIPKTMADKFLAKSDLIEEKKSIEAEIDEHQEAINNATARIAALRDRVAKLNDELSADESATAEDIQLIAEAIRNRHNHEAVQTEPDKTETKGHKGKGGDK